MARRPSQQRPARAEILDLMDRAERTLREITQPDGGLSGAIRLRLLRLANRLLAMLTACGVRNSQ